MKWALVILAIVEADGTPAAWWRVENAQFAIEPYLYELTFYSDTACSVKITGNPDLRSDFCTGHLCDKLTDGVVDRNWPIGKRMYAMTQAGEQYVDVEFDPPADVKCVDAPDLGRSYSSRRRGHQGPYNGGVALRSSDDKQTWTKVARSLTENRVIVSDDHVWEEEDISDADYNDRLTNFYREGAQGNYQMYDSAKKMSFNGWWISADMLAGGDNSYQFATGKPDYETTLVFGYSGGTAVVRATLRGSGFVTVEMVLWSGTAYAKVAGVTYLTIPTSDREKRMKVTMPFEQGEKLEISANAFQLYSLNFSTTTSTRTATSTTSTTATTTSSTITSSTTTIPPAHCSSTHMECPLPARGNGTWEVVGSEDVVGCAVDVDVGETTVFRVDSRTCHTAVDVAGDLVTETATFRFRTEKAASEVSSFVFRGVTNLVECRCQTASSGAAGRGIEVAMPGVDVTEGAYPFNASLVAYTSAEFTSALQPGEAFPLDASRMYFEVATPNPALILGTRQCVASPSESQSDPHAVVFLDSSCLTGALQVQTLSESQPNIFRFSTEAFKFVGRPKVYMRCEVVFCNAEPCGVCSAPRRKLRAESEDNRIIVASSSVHVELGPLMLVLPGAITEDMMHTVWTGEQNFPSQWLPVNVTLFGPFANYTDHLLNTLASNTAAVISTIVAHNATVLRISAATETRSAGTQHNPDEDAEALSLECIVEVPSASASSLVATRMSAAFATKFIPMLREGAAELPAKLNAEWASGSMVVDLQAPTTSAAAPVTDTQEPTTSSTASASSTAMVKMVVENVDYHSLIADPDLRKDFERSVKEATADSSPLIDESDVVVELLSGSVIVHATVALPPEAAETVVAQIADPKKALAEKVAERVAALPRIGTVAMGAITVNLKEVTSTVTTLTTTTSTQKMTFMDTSVHAAQSQGALMVGVLIFQILK